MTSRSAGTTPLGPSCTIVRRAVASCSSQASEKRVRTTAPRPGSGEPSSSSSTNSPSAPGTTRTDKRRGLSPAASSMSAALTSRLPARARTGMRSRGRHRTRVRPSSAGAS